ncbi:MAG TPA: hypothetical protein VK750_02120 [Cytophagaceae bacterium]|jgi:hypothetical protein|nr:hypothetical protein [Cytophagaceae bacterium]
MLSSLVRTYCDIFHIYIKYDNATIEGSRPFAVKCKMLLTALVSSARNLFKGSYTDYSGELHKAKHWFFVIHENNVESLKVVQKGIADSVFVSTYKMQVPNTIVLHYPLRMVYSLFSPVLFFLLWRKYPKTVWDNFHIMVPTLGIYSLSLRYLKKHRPESITFANDHSPFPRALFLAAKSLGIKTIYLSHGATSYHFPPLSYGLSLLEGENMLDQYKLSGSVNSEVKLIGVPRLDEYVSHKNHSATVKKIGLCVNDVDDVSFTIALIESIKSKFPDLMLSFRQHPSDRRNFNISALFPDVVISVFHQEKTYDFLMKQDMIIAGDSTIHLEACYVNVVACYFPLTADSKVDNDYYGFVEKKLLEKLVNKEDLFAYIKENTVSKKNVNAVVQYYNAVLGTSLEGKSGAYAIACLKAYLQK